MIVQQLDQARESRKPRRPQALPFAFLEALMGRVAGFRHSGANAKNELTPWATAPEKLRAVHSYDAQRSGVNEERSGSGRPPVGHRSVGGRGAENPASSSEKSAAAPVAGQNAHLDGALLAVAS